LFPVSVLRAKRHRRRSITFHKPTGLAGRVYLGGSGSERTALH